MMAVVMQPDQMQQPQMQQPQMQEPQLADTENKEPKRINLDDDEKKDVLEEIERNYRESTDHLSDWLKEAEMAYDYRAGDQWSIQDRADLMEEQRAIMTFNRIDTFIDAVAGMEIQNRQEVRYLPRERRDVKVNEILTDTAKWARDQCDAEDEETDAFGDMLTCGLGIADTWVNFRMNPEGEIQIDRRDPMRYRYDPNATKKNLADRRFDMYIFDMDIKEVEEQWEVKVESTIGIWDSDIDRIGRWNHTVDRSEQKYVVDERSSMKRRGTVRVCRHQKVRIEPRIRMSTPQGPKDFTVERATAINNLAMAQGVNPPRQVRVNQKRIIQTWVVGKQILWHGIAPSPDDFSIQPMTGKRDKNKGYWYGVVRPLMSPQQWANKLVSTLLDIFSRNAKGGIIAEQDAFVSQHKAQEEWNRADSITMVNAGALQQGKIQPKPEAPMNEGLFRILDFSVNSFKDTSGVNLEFIGLADRDQAGVLEDKRKQASLSVLAWAFDSMRRYRKTEGRLLAHLIKDYISDGRLVRINGEHGLEYIPLVRQALTYEFDIIVDESPSAPNFKDKTWKVVETLLPILVSAGIAIPPDVVDYAPLPSTLAEKWKALLQPKNDPEADEETRRERKIAQATAIVELEKTRSEAAKNMADVTQALVENQKMMAEIRKILSEANLAQAKEADTLETAETKAIHKNDPPSDFVRAGMKQEEIAAQERMRQADRESGERTTAFNAMQRNQQTNQGNNGAE